MRTEINVITGEITEHEDYEDYGQYVTPADKNKATASSLLSETDWVNQPDVADPDNPPYLSNKAEFITYRSLLRAIAINPTDGDLDWPVQPTAVWK